MQPFSISIVDDPSVAVATVTRDPHAAFIAGGTTIVDLMKNDITNPALLVDIDRLPYASIERLPSGGLMIGALAKMSDTAAHPLVKAGYPVVSQALLASASSQLRNMASIGGNLMQRTRCYYFRDTGTACNKRKNGEGCTALAGLNRIHAVVGGSNHCICTHPSDLAVALVAMDAIVHTRGANGERRIPLSRFYTLPGTTPQIETVLHHGELITGVELPPSALAATSYYRKVRDRASYEFALVSVAAGIHMGHGRIAAARLAFGGIAPIPWRSHDAEAALVGRPATHESFRHAAEVALHGAIGRTHNAFKIELAKRTAVRALASVGGIA